MKRQVTKWLMVIAAVVLLAWDVVVATTPPKGDTMSEILMGWAWRCSTLPFLWGVATGHLFWTVDILVYKWERIAALWGLGFVVFGVDWYVTNVPPLWPLLAGLVAGRLLWPQAHRNT